MTVQTNLAAAIDAYIQANYEGSLAEISATTLNLETLLQLQKSLSTDGGGGGKLLGFAFTRLTTAVSQSFSQNVQTAISGLEIAYTPLSAASKLLISVDFNGYFFSGASTYPLFGLLKNSSPVGNVGSQNYLDSPILTSPEFDGDFSFSVKASYRYIDDSVNTSARTYKATATFTDPPDNTLFINRDSVDATVRSSCLITVMEIAS